MEIREVTKEDRETIRELELLCFKEYLEKSEASRWEEISQDLIDQLGVSSENTFDHYLEQGMSYVALEEGRMVGFLFAKIIHHVYDVPTAVWLENMGVHPEHRRRGVGYRLLEHLIKEGSGREADVLLSSIMTDNLESIMLHRKLGFLMDDRKMAFLGLDQVEP
ncbi:MAG: N-acetyltransferase family protein [Methanomassiliicoccales archaeon]